MLALSLTALLIVAALVLDGGQGYAQRRQIQNAADAAAMAGARALDRYRFPPAGTTPDVTTIPSAVNSVASANGSTSVTSCRLINFDQVGTSSDLGPCTSATAANEAEGVRVSLSGTFQTFFGEFTGKKTLTANNTAAATIQDLISADAPFIICGNPALGGYNLLNPDGTLNPSNAANSGEITIHGSQVPDCGANSQFKGLDGGPIELNSWVDIGEQGNKVGQYRDVTTSVNPCPDGGPYDNCDMLLPIMQAGRASGAGAQAYVTAFAVFHVTEGHTGGDAHTAHYVGVSSSIATGGEGAGIDLGGVNPGLVRLIKLAE
jgi:Flp pilus assembly protein TadG